MVLSTECVVLDKLFPTESFVEYIVGSPYSTEYIVGDCPLNIIIFCRYEIEIIFAPFRSGCKYNKI